MANAVPVYQHYIDGLVQDCSISSALAVLHKAIQMHR